MANIRVLIYERSAFFRRLLTSVLQTEGIDVVATHKDGDDIATSFRNCLPDVVLLDIDSPQEGLTVLSTVRECDQQVPILMIRCSTLKSGESTLKALSAGANGFVSKPKTENTQAAIKIIKTEIIPTIKKWYDRSRLRRVAPKNTAAISKSPTKTTSSQAVCAVPKKSTPTTVCHPKVLAIASSTGGPAALKTLFQALPRTLQIPVLVVQHMPANFTRLLAEQLDRECQISVTEAKHGDVLHPEKVWVAPGGHHMTVDLNRGEMMVQLNTDPPENSVRPAADVLFRSLAQTLGKNVLAVVLTGMGCDGTQGSSKIKEAGGVVFSQHRADCTVWGMPRSIEEAGLADKVVPLDKMSETIVQFLGAKATIPSLAKSDA